MAYEPKKGIETEVAYYRRQAEYGGLKGDQVRRLKNWRTASQGNPDANGTGVGGRGWQGFTAQG
jgi:hypothetical protein